MSGTERVVILVDMDCFYCQVEEKLNPSLKGKPVAVVQYNAWKGGGLIAVNYEAKDKGVTRHMRGTDAKEKCPDIVLVKVPTVREKADLTRYRDAGKQVAKVLQTFTSLLERASVDEAYLDITESVNNRIATFSSVTPDQLSNTHILGFASVAEYLKELSADEYLNDSNVKLAIGGVIAEEIRAAVYESTGYRCSAGIAHNKVLAKLTAGLHKPNQQTVLPHESIPTLYENLSVKKIRSMGGKFGEFVTQKLNITMMGELIKFTRKELQNHFEDKTANWLYNIARGIDLEPVTVRLIAKSIGCCKRFPGRGALVTEDSVKHWVKELSIEIAERIEKDIAENNRKPKQMIISYSQKVGRKVIANTRSQSLHTVEQEKMYLDSYEIVKKNCQRNDGSFCVTFLGLNVSKFEENRNVTDIASFFKSATKDNKLTNGKTICNGEKTKDRAAIHEELNKVSQEIESVIETNIKLNGDFAAGQDSFFQKYTTHFNSKSETIPINNCANVDNYESDDSEAELEAINSSTINEKCQNDKIASEPTKNSFFHNFLKKVEPPKRDFNTSVNLDELPETEEDERNSSSSDQEQHIENMNETDKESPVIGKSLPAARINKFFQNNNLLAGPSTSTSNSYITDDNKELCAECNKLIPVEEIVSHLDYHFAIKMVREEAHLYKPAVVKTADSSVTNKRKEVKLAKETKAIDKPDKNKNTIIGNQNNNARKRKSTNNKIQGAVITNFLNLNKGNDDDNSEICPDCSKRIKLDEYASHVDYHVAKKLHLEINVAAAKTKTKEINAGKCEKDMNNSNKKPKASVATYFTKL